ncbi:MAG: polyphosphate:AMP phosphotransferase [Oscillospiraceae bacterium]|nr:polyphosphate:AMP phosphotransferase [Oscillospiraceae bacterium]
MLDSVNLQKTTMKEEYKPESRKLKEELAMLQLKLREKKLPVIILFEGWSAAGKGSLISDMILTLDPRNFKVYSTMPPTVEEQRKPLMWRHWNVIPARGQMTILDRSWYQDVSIARIEQDLSEEDAFRRMDSIKTFERQLTDDGYLIIKFFLHISQKEQKKRLDRLEEDSNTSWRVTKQDRRRNRDYEEYYQVFDQMLEYTSTENAPWHPVSCHDKRSALIEIYHTVIDSINEALARKEQPKEVSPIDAHEKFNLVKMPRLADIDLDRHIDEEEYRRLLKKKQERLRELHNELYRKKIPVVVCYEGWDAAGKGGNIKRVAAALDPRGYEAIPIAAPTSEELAHHHLWRFWRRLPKTGHIAIFDRTWYGRLMVERLEGFCSEDDWHRAFTELNEFEKELHDWGAVIVKFWIHIDKDEQYRRFMDRQNTPAKQWKLTDEDWRNREKWDLYEEAVDDMLQLTSTDFAPWTIIESNDKKFARLKALTTLIDAIENRLGK